MPAYTPGRYNKVGTPINKRGKALELRHSMRRKMIEIARRRQQPGSGSPASFLRRRTAVVQYPDLSPVFTNLRWAVIGGVTTRQYMAERATEDLDIAVRREDGDETRRRLLAAGFKYQNELVFGGSSWAFPIGSGLAVVEVATPWIDQALEEALQNLDIQGLPVLPLAYLVLMKFESSRLQDVADISRMLGLADAKILESVRQVFNEFLPDEIGDLESLIVSGRMEVDHS